MKFQCQFLKFYFYLVFRVILLEDIKADLQISDTQLGLLTGPAFAVTNAIAGIPRDRITTIYNPTVTPDLDERASAPVDHPWFADGGPPVVLAVGREFKVLAKNELDDESVFNATPLISNGQLFLRSDKALYCIGE